MAGGYLSLSIMSNQANNDKSSILVDVENLLDVYEPAFLRMPKTRRIHGAAVRMEEAAYDLIDFFSTAYDLPNGDEKRYWVLRMVGAYGRMQSAFKRLMKVKVDTQVSTTTGESDASRMNLLSDSVKLEIAMYMERIEKGIIKWKNSIKGSASYSPYGQR